MFRDIDAYSDPLRHESRGEWEASPTFFENQKGAWFWKKSPDCVHLWIKLSIQNVVLRVSQRKNSQKVCLRVFLSCFDKMFIEVR